MLSRPNSSVMDAKIATLTSDIKKNFVGAEDLSRAYIIHEKDLYNLALLALKGIETRRGFEKQHEMAKNKESLENSDELNKESLENSDELMHTKTSEEGEKSVTSEMKGGMGASDQATQWERDNWPNDEMKNEVKNILRSDFFSIDAKEFLINDLLQKFRREKTLHRERQITQRSPPQIKGNFIGAGNLTNHKSDSNESYGSTKPETNVKHFDTTRFSCMIMKAMNEIKRLCKLRKEQTLHLKTVAGKIKAFLPLIKNGRCYSQDSKFFFQDNYIVTGTVRFPLPKLLAVFALERAVLFRFLSSRGRVSKFSQHEKTFLKKFSKMSGISCNLIH